MCLPKRESFRVGSRVDFASFRLDEAAHHGAQMDLSLSLLRNRLQVALSCGERLRRAAGGRAFSKWLAHTNARRQTSLSLSLLRLNLRNQFGIGRRLVNRYCGRAFATWRQRTAETRAALVGTAWRKWWTQVYSQRCVRT